MTQGLDFLGTSELLHLARTACDGCLICRSIVEANADFDGVLVPVRLGTMVLPPDMQVLHLRSCTARLSLRPDPRS